jgi:RimJ/RimL family protein N-acetyltransferase
VIRGERVVLRPHQPRDAVRLEEAGADAVTQESLQHFPAPFTAAAARAYLDRRAELAATGGGLHWTAADPVTDEALCFLGVFGVTAGHQAEIGYFAHPDARGRGVTSEAVALACRHAFVPEEDGGLGLRRLELLTDATNAASQRVAERAGFTLVGRERASTRRRDGSLADQLRYDLLAEELTGAAR